MSRRGKQIAAEMAMRHQELTGITKAYGVSLEKQLRPFGEGVAMLEKSAGTVTGIQRELIAGQQELIDRQQMIIDFSSSLLERLAAAQQSGQLRGGFEQFKPSEWEVKRRAGNMVQRHMNGFDHHIPESNGSVPHEP